MQKQELTWKQGEIWYCLTYTNLRKREAIQKPERDAWREWPHVAGSGTRLCRSAFSYDGLWTAFRACKSFILALGFLFGYIALFGYLVSDSFSSVPNTKEWSFSLVSILVFQVCRAMKSKVSTDMTMWR